MDLNLRGLGNKIKDSTVLVLTTTRDGLRDLFSGLFSNPRKFITFIIAMIVVVLLTYFMSFFLFLLPLVVFYLALWNGRSAWERRKGRRIGIVGFVVILIITVLIITPLTLGYLIYENSRFSAAHLPRDHTDAGSGNGWVKSDFEGYTFSESLQGGLAVYESIGYEFEGGESPPYPGIIIVVTIKSVPMTTLMADSTRDDMHSEVEDRIKQLDDDDFQGLVLDRSSKVTGERTLKNGHTSQYFEYRGKIETSPSDPLIQNFVAGGKIRIRGETWACSETGTVVSAAGAAQYGYTFEPGTFKYGYAYAHRDYPDDQRTWVTLKNHINNMVCS